MGMIIRDVCPRCQSPKYKKRLLLDSRVVALTKACHPIFVILSSSKPLSFKCLQVELKALGQIAA
jgi:hypothetical protein